MDSLFLHYNTNANANVKNCLNPCFNGFTILTQGDSNNGYRILVGLNPCFNGFTILTIDKKLKYLNVYMSQSLF